MDSPWSSWQHRVDIEASDNFWKTWSPSPFTLAYFLVALIFLIVIGFHIADKRPCVSVIVSNVPAGPRQSFLLYPTATAHNYCSSAQSCKYTPGTFYSHFLLHPMSISLIICWDLIRTGSQHKSSVTEWVLLIELVPYDIIVGQS